MNMNRRTFLAAAGSLALAPVLAQTKREPARVGWLHASSTEAALWQLTAFQAGMLALGWKEGEHYLLEQRWAEFRGDEHMAMLAAQLAAIKPAVIVAAPNDAVRAALKAAPDTPIVMATGIEPVRFGFAASLARPGGTVTGNSNVLGDISEKYPELLLECAPGLRRIGFLHQNQGRFNQAHQDRIRRVAAIHSLDARIGEINAPADVDAVLARFAAERVQALIVNIGPMLMARRKQIAQTALERGWPTIAFTRVFADDGALMSYGPDFVEQFRRTAYFVDRILKGAKPADLPFEEPNRVELVLNLKTAQALKLKIPRSIIARADRVIE